MRATVAKKELTNLRLSRCATLFSLCARWKRGPKGSAARLEESSSGSEAFHSKWRMSANVRTTVKGDIKIKQKQEKKEKLREKERRGLDARTRLNRENKETRGSKRY